MVKPFTPTISLQGTTTPPPPTTISNQAHEEDKISNTDVDSVIPILSLTRLEISKATEILQSKFHETSRSR